MDNDLENLCNLVFSAILKESKYKSFLTQEEYEKYYPILTWLIIYRNKLESKLKR
jgi:hypothetical protein